MRPPLIQQMPVVKTLVTEIISFIEVKSGCKEAWHNAKCQYLASYLL